MRALSLPLLLCLVLALPAGLAAEAPAAAKEQKELARVRARIQALQSRLEKDRDRRDELQVELEDIEKSITRSQQQLRDLREQIEAQQRKAETTRSERAAAQAALEEQRQALGRQLRAAYVIGQSGQLKLLLNQEGAQKVGRVLTYYDYLNRARGKRIQSIFAQLDFVRAIEEKLRADLDGLTELKQEQQDALAALEKTRGERNRTIRRLADRIADTLDELKQAEASEQQIQALIQNLKDVLADIPVDLGDKAFAQQRGKLPWPLRGKLLANFGQAKAGGKFSWKGLWIAADEGDPVRAVARGRVAYAGWMQRYGLIAILEHENGYYTLYGHLQRVPRSEGEWVNAGETLALAGNTGGYDQHGVYFEVRKGREALNPGEWLSK